MKIQYSKLAGFIAFAALCFPLFSAHADYFENEITELTFIPAATLTVGTHPRCVVSADINGDNKPDLISANFGTNTLTIYTNNGAGGFVIASSPGVGSGPQCVIAADVNGDNKPDLISANYNGHSLTILTNNGNGQFVLASSPTVGNQPACVIAADVNGDNKLDLITANYGDGSLTVLTNNGRGSFSLAATIPVGGQPVAVAAADLDGDHKIDLISANHGDGTLSVLQNDGAGGFTLACTPNVSSAPDGVIVTDVDGDGRLDLVSVCSLDGSISVDYNDGDITDFNGPSNPGTGWPVDGGPVSVIATDVNSDGRSDLVTANFTTNTMSILANIGAHGMAMATSPGVGRGPRCVAAADVNGDGKMDLITANDTDGTLTVLTNASTLFFKLASWINITQWGNRPACVVAADINNDGKMDLISQNQSGNLTVFTNKNGSDFGFDFALPVQSSLSAQTLVVADFNGDGKPDLLQVGGDSASVYSVYTNNARGGFALASTNFCGGYSSCLAVGDFNGDNKMDFVVGNSDATWGNPLGQFGHVAVFTNSGNGVFGLNAVITGASGSPNGPTALVTQNFNNDNHVDIIGSATTDNYLTEFLNTGNSFSSNHVAVGASGVDCLAVADFNGDGKLDLAAGNYLSDPAGQLYVLTNNGSGGFTISQTVTIGKGPMSVIAADINGDGKPDLITANSQDLGNDGNGSVDFGTLTVLTNNGSGGFVVAETLDIGGSAQSVTAADVNGDGRLDLICANLQDDSLLVLTNSLNFATTVSVPKLAIRQSGTTVTVYWNDSPGWTLQQTPSLSSPSWSASSGVNLSSGTNYLNLVSPPGRQFFRLMHP
jgi:hypothetical protein